MKRHIPVLLLVLALLCSCSPSSGEQARTYYETLDLGTPEAAVESFVDAFHRSDFMTVYLVLSPEAQRAWHEQIQRLRYQDLFQCEEDSCRKMMEEAFPDGPFEGEHSPDGWYLFDQLMVVAQAQKALLIDLSGEVKIVGRHDAETYQGKDAVDLVATVEGIGEQVTFRMVQAPSGRWRVFQVILSGGDEEMAPWAIAK
ncbi:MAG: hypothetical protein JXM73_18365 [Anaerolineae bacterium]|nr:hypothetical protein [Anaerolineae bacterium]